jgi:hypothetical protein
VGGEWKGGVPQKMSIEFNIGFESEFIKLSDGLDFRKGE